MKLLKRMGKLHYFVNSIIFLLIFILGSLSLTAQKSLIDNKYIFSSTLGFSNTSDLPFWSRVNQYGQAPASGNFIQLSGSAYHDYDSLLTRNKKLQPWGLGYGLGLTGNLTTNKSVLLLPEAYLKIRHKNWAFYAGRRKEIFGLTDSAMTSGSYIWSGNALPMPKVQIHTPSFVPVGKKGLISYKAGISHGWFGKDSIIQNYWLHQKWLYGKVGKGKVQFMAGLNHQVQWGGYSEILKNVGGQYPPTIDGYLAPKPLYSYQYILLPFLQKFVPPSPEKVPAYDGGLAIGNQLGSVDIALQVKLSSATLLIYKQQPYDFARSIVNLNNVEDGLHGISWSRHTSGMLDKVILEFFNSKSQGRFRFGQYNASNFGEIDNYFSHGQYQSWSYQGVILGNPFILKNPVNGRISNNRLHYFYLGLSGQVGSIHYFSRQVYSRNFGTYAAALSSNQYSGSFELSYPLRRQNFIVRVAWDKGNVYPSVLGWQTSYTFSL